MRAAATPEITARQFRDAIGLFATGVAVIAAECDGEIRAMTANSVSSLSLAPMLVLFCPAKQARLAEYLPRIETFSINILRAEQLALSSYFAGAWREPAPPPYRFVRERGVPRLQGCLAALGCAVQQVLDGGDHWLVIGAVRTLHQGIGPHAPLVYFGGSYRELLAAAGPPAPDFSAAPADEPAHIHYP